MKIGIIGSGIAGLTVAHRLSSDCHVTLFERNDRPGMDAFRTVVGDSPVQEAADVPSRMFNGAQWPSLVELYDELGVAYQPVDATQSFSHAATDGSSPESFLQFDVAYQPALNFKHILSARVRTIMGDARRLMKDGRRDLDIGAAKDLSFQQYLADRKYSREFIYDFLYPTLSSTVCTCSYEALNNYPAAVILECLRNLNIDRGLLRTTNGSIDVVQRLVRNIDELETGCPVDAVRLENDKAVIRTGGNNVAFDHVVVATQANTALGLLNEVTEVERSILGSIRYEDIHVALHCDDNLMPRSRSYWSTFNMISRDKGSNAACTVWLNRFHSDWKIRKEYFQTISPGSAVESKNTIAAFKMQRPVVDKSTSTTLEQLEQINREQSRRIWFCGSWAAYGVPLLETGVVSANAIAQRIKESRLRSDATQVTR